MKRYLVFLVLLLSVFASSYGYHTAEEWKSRTIYQLITDRFAPSVDTTAPCANLSDYCGGTFQGISNHLDYIQGMGFDAIWISPVIVNTPAGYHGYWSKEFFDINPYFGTSDDLVSMVKMAHSRNIWVMIDVVVNHVGPVDMQFNEIAPFNTNVDYHPDCQVVNYVCFTDEVFYCRLSNLPDLNQTNTTVRSELMQYGNWLLSTFDFDGIRADTVMYIDQDFWVEFQQNMGTYIMGEVWSDLSCVVAYQKKGVDGLVSYPMFFTLRDVFQNGNSMNEIQSQVQAYQAFPNVSLLGTFIDNHDNARFLYNNENKINQYMSAITYVMMSDGIPIIYYGTEQAFDGGNDPYNREVLWTSGYDTTAQLYTFISNVVAFRKKAQVWNYSQVQRYSTDNFYAFTKGDAFVALTNQVENTVTETITYESYPDGTKLCNIFSDGGDCVVVQNGQFSVTLGLGLPKIYYPVSQ